MKKILMIITMVCIVVLTACSSKYNTPSNLEDFYDLFLSDEFDNVTIAYTNYNNVGVASTGDTIKVDGENYQIIVSRDEEYYYNITEDKSVKYTEVDGVWMISSINNVVVDSMAMDSLLYGIIPSSISCDDFEKESGTYFYYITTETIFNTKVKKYEITFTSDYVEVNITETITVAGEDSSSIIKIQDIKISNFENTKVTIPEIDL